MNATRQRQAQKEALKRPVLLLKNAQKNPKMMQKLKLITEIQMKRTHTHQRLNRTETYNILKQQIKRERAEIQVNQSDDKIQMHRMSSLCHFESVKQ